MIFKPIIFHLPLQLKEDYDLCDDTECDTYYKFAYIHNYLVKDRRISKLFYYKVRFWWVHTINIFCDTII